MKMNLKQQKQLLLEKAERCRLKAKYSDNPRQVYKLLEASEHYINKANNLLKDTLKTNKGRI
jgi:hypothetical protein